jgi:hypothetical protein
MSREMSDNVAPEEMFLAPGVRCGFSGLIAACVFALTHGVTPRVNERLIWRDPGGSLPLPKVVTTLDRGGYSATQFKARV